MDSKKKTALWRAKFRQNFEGGRSRAEAMEQTSKHLLYWEDLTPYEARKKATKPAKVKKAVKKKAVKKKAK